MLKVRGGFGGAALVCLGLMILASPILLGGCATIGSAEVKEKLLWQSRDQFVKIEQQEHPEGVTVVSNAQPVDVSIEKLRSMLGSIEILPAGDGQGTRLFNKEDLDILSQNIHTGLQKSGPEDDIVFAIIGHYPALMGLMKERMVTTGRVFCRGRDFNIIFGDVHRSLRENEDRRLQPFLPGSRGGTPSHEWRLAAIKGGEIFTAKRQDWLTFSLDAPSVSLPVSEKPKEIKEEQQAPASIPTHQQSLEARKSVEERLILLNDLYNKKLISDEEYRAKRLQILNDL